MERTVTLWYLHRQMLLNELALVEAELVQGSPVSSPETGPLGVVNGAVEVARVAADSSSGEGSRVSAEELKERYRAIQDRLDKLGPCPRPMMG